MSDRKEYIERGALMAQIEATPWLDYIGAHHGYSLHYDINGIIMDQPAADVVEVVRCRECRKRGRDECPCHVKGEPADEELLKDLDDDYCSYGERKDGADNEAD